MARKQLDKTLDTPLPNDLGTITIRVVVLAKNDAPSAPSADDAPKDADPDEETRAVMEAQSERLYAETKALLARRKPLTEHLVERLLAVHEMSLAEALAAVREFESS